METCEQNAINYDGSFLFEPEKCKNCHKCAQSCPTQTLRTIGYHLNPDELYDILLRDKIYYQISQGGVTFSGGEPLIHIDYIYIFN